MTERLPYVQQNRSVLAGGGHNAQEWRWLNAQLGGAAGVDNAAACKVTSAGALDVSVAAGGALIPDIATPGAGLYHAYNDAPVSLTLDPASLTQFRIDRVIYQVLDTASGDPEDRARITVVRGTDHASNPVAPTLPRASIPLASAFITASAVAINQGNITDERVAAGAWRAPRGVVWQTIVPNGTNVQSSGELDTIFSEVVPTVPGRYYTYGFTGVVIFANADAAGDVKLLVGGGLYNRLFQTRAVTAGNSFAVNARTNVPRLATATSHTLSATVQRTVGTGTMTIDTAFQPIAFAMYDEGGTVI